MLQKHKIKEVSDVIVIQGSLVLFNVRDNYVKDLTKCSISQIETSEKPGRMTLKRN